jgi:hypothetical protein
MAALGGLQRRGSHTRRESTPSAYDGEGRRTDALRPLPTTRSPSSIRALHLGTPHGRVQNLPEPALVGPDPSRCLSRLAARALTSWCCRARRGFWWKRIFRLALPLSRQLVPPSSRRSACRPRPAWLRPRPAPRRSPAGSPQLSCPTLSTAPFAGCAHALPLPFCLRLTGQLLSVPRCSSVACWTLDLDLPLATRLHASPPCPRDALRRGADGRGGCAPRGRT